MDIEGVEMDRITRIASKMVAGTSLDGMSNQRAKRRINEVLKRHTKGFFSDEYWAPVNDTWKALTDEGIDWTLEGTKYDHDRDNVPTSKTWTFKVEFLNDRGRPTTVYGVIVASGAGSCDFPLDKYDLVAYVS
jgi:hypothetical protein